jgi:hypothetical protein
MVKILIFVLLLAGIMIYPIFESKNFKKIKEYNTSLPPVVLKNGKFYEYEPNLTKSGSFSEFIVNKTSYFGRDVLLDNLQAQEKIFLKKAFYKKPVLKGFDVKFVSKEYNLTTDKGIYNTQTSILKGEKFAFQAESFKGFGVNFIVDKNKNIKADDITYFLKVKK